MDSRSNNLGGKIRHEHLFFLEDGRPDQRPGDHPLALEREHQGAQYSKGGTLLCAAFFRDVAAHARKVMLRMYAV